MQATILESLEKDAEFQQAWGGFVARCMKEDLPFDKTAEDSDLIHFLQNHGGVTAVSAIMKAATSDPKFASAILDFYPTVDSLYVTQFNESLAPKEAQTKVTVETEVKDYMDGKMKSKIVRDGFVLNDDRNAEEQSEVYDVDYQKRFSSPDTPGLYHVLLRSGGTVDAWVFMPAGKKKYMGNCVVVHPDGEHHFLAEPGAVFIRDDEVIEGLTRLGSSLRVGDPYDPKTVVGPVISSVHRDRTRACSGTRYNCGPAASRCLMRLFSG